MKTLNTWITILFGFACTIACADDLYFGGMGETNTHWIGYQISLRTTKSIAWTAYTLDSTKDAEIKIAPAIFSPVGTNAWTAIFDEHAFTTNGEVIIGLSKHDLHILSIRDGQSIQIQDGKDKIELLKISSDALKQIRDGQIPNKSSTQTPGRHL